MADLGGEIAALGHALGNLDQARGSVRADAEAVATSLVEQWPADLDPLVTTADVPIGLADQLDARVTSRAQLCPEGPLVPGELRDLRDHLVGRPARWQAAVVPGARGDTGPRAVRAPRQRDCLGGWALLHLAITQTGVLHQSP